MIDYLDVSRTYTGARGSVNAVDGVTLTIGEGELCVLLGPSGCGKTTLLRMTNRLIDPTSGTITVSGRDVMQQDPVTLRRGIGYVIQGVGLFPHRTVAENVATTLELARMDRERIARRVDELLAMMNLDPERYRDRYPAELSGGEQQRVGVARALAADPPILLMDEPFGAIDPINRASIQREFLDLQRRLRKTILFVSHDIDEAFLLADRIVLMRAGKIEQQGSPLEIASRPATTFVEQFFGARREMLLLDTLHVADAIETSVEISTEDPRSVIDAGATLRTALMRLLSEGAPALVVTGDDNTRLGTISLRSIQDTIAQRTRPTEHTGEPAGISSRV